MMISENLKGLYKGIKALLRMFDEAAPERGQHDMRYCRYCSASESYHFELTHKEGCPVAAAEPYIEYVRDAIENYKEGE